MCRKIFLPSSPTAPSPHPFHHHLQTLRSSVSTRFAYSLCCSIFFYILFWIQWHFFYIYRNIIDGLPKKKRFSHSLVHDHSFRSLVTTMDCFFSCWIQRYFWKFSTIIDVSPTFYVQNLISHLNSFINHHSDGKNVK